MDISVQWNGTALDTITNVQPSSGAAGGAWEVVWGVAGALAGEDVPVRSLIYIVSAAAQAPFTLAYEVRHAYGVDTASEAEIEMHADALIRLLIRD